MASNSNLKEKSYLLDDPMEIGDNEGVEEMAKWVVQPATESLPHLDKKPRLGETEDLPVEVAEDIACEVVNPLPKFAIHQLGLSEEQERLMAAGLHHFGLWLAVIPASDPMLVKSFLERYSEPERRLEMLPGMFTQLDTEQVAKVFGLPIGGLAVTNLKESQFGMLPCLQPGTVTTELDVKSDLVEVKRIAKSAIIPSWRMWIQWVQTYLELDEDPIWTTPRTIKAAVAIHQGEKLNWAKHMAKKLHDLVIAARKNAAIQFGAGQYLTKLIRDQMGTAHVERVKFIKLEPRESTSQSEEPVPLTKSSYLASRILELAEVMKTPDESAIQVEVLQKANAELQVQLDTYKAQLETMTTQHGEEKTKWASLLHQSNQKLITSKIALRSVESKITNLEL